MCDRVASGDPFVLKYCLNRYKVQKMWDKVVEDCMSTLKLAPDWFVQTRSLKIFMLLYSLIMIYSFLMKILVKSDFLVVKWVFIVKIFITLTSVMMIFMKMILKLTFMSDFWLGAINLKNANHVKEIEAKD